MTSIQEAAAALHAALDTVEALGKRVYEDPSAVVQGVGVVIAPPLVSFGTFGGADPTEATFIVHLVVPFNQYATARLYDYVEPMVQAIERNPLFSVPSATPGLLQQGGTQLPTYAITVDVGR